MAVRPETLENPERGLSLVTREPAEVEPVEDSTAGDHAAVELRALRDRIQNLKERHPKDTMPHCRACYERGVEAALCALDEG